MSAQTMTIPSPLLSTQEAATVLQVSPTTLREWRAAGTGPAAVRVAGRFMFDAAEVAAHAVLRACGEPAYKVIAPADLSRQEWLKIRLQGLGGSDAAAALGLDPYRSAYQLWLEKTGRWTEDDAGEAADWGNRLEPVVAARFSERHPELILTRSPGVLAHAEHPWLIANPDRLAVDPKVGQAEVIEIKAPGFMMTKDWVGEDAPARYIVQLQVYFAVTGARGGYFGALLGGQTYVEKRVERDDELIALLIERLGEWWQRHVVDDEPPEMDGSDRTGQVLGRLYEVDPDAVAELPEETDGLLADLAKIKTQQGELDEERGRVENRLRELLGPVEVGLRDGTTAVTWKRNGTFAAKRFEKDHPDLHQQYLTTKPALDTKALAADHPHIYSHYRARTLRPKEL